MPSETASTKESAPFHFKITENDNGSADIRICYSAIDEDEMDWLIRYANGRKIGIMACDYKIEVSLTPR